MIHYCELMLRSDQFFLTTAAANELRQFIQPAHVVLASDAEGKERLPEPHRIVGHAQAEHVSAGADGWPRVGVWVTLDDDLDDAILDGVASGKIGVGVVAEISYHHCRQRVADRDMVEAAAMYLLEAAGYDPVAVDTKEIEHRLEYHRAQAREVLEMALKASKGDVDHHIVGGFVSFSHLALVPGSADAIMGVDARWHPR